MKSKMILGGVLAATLLGAGIAQAQVAITIAPPAPRHEVVPAPRPGHIWAPGHYQWRHGQYVWVAGHWERMRHGHEWREARWVQRPNGEWFMVGGNWERRGPMGDRDRDGIPNAYDNHNNRRGPMGDRDRDGVPNAFDQHNDRRGGAWGDRDGDGVPNARDRRPNNPNRS